MPISTEKDAETLVRLLREYTNSLQGILKERERLDATSLWSTVAASVGFAALLVSLGPGVFVNTWTQSAAYAVSVAVIALAILITAYLWTFGKRRKLANEEIEILGRKLSKMVHLASQLAEHSNSVLGVRLELDLRLIEAET